MDFGVNLEWDTPEKLGKKFNMYKVERKIATSGVWQEVMLSPFNTRDEVKIYHAKYSRYYPDPEDRVYRVTNLETGGMKLIK